MVIVDIHVYTLWLIDQGVLRIAQWLLIMASNRPCNIKKN